MKIEIETKKTVKNGIKGATQKNITYTLMAAPALILVFIFNYLPMFGLVIAFKNFRYDQGILGSAWCGFKNFEFFFKSSDAVHIIGNTILMNVLFIITGLFGAVILAILLNEVKKKIFVKTYQTVMLIPFFLSMTVVANIVYGFLEYKYGIVNTFLTALGMDKVIWYNESQYWRFILTMVNWWKNVGYNCIIFYAGIMGIEPTYYEAASIDGAGKLKRFTHITIPLIRPLVITMLILQTGSIMTSDMGLFYIVTRNSAMLYEKIDVINTYVYRAMISSGGDMGMTAAIGMFQSVTGMILVLLSNFLAKKYNESGAIF